MPLDGGNAMANRPAHKRNDVNCRDGVWQHMRSIKRFTLNDIWLETNMHKRTISEFIRGLVKAGHLQVVEVVDNGKRFDASVYELVKSPRDTPRVRKDGSPVTQGRARLQMWRAMKVLKTFDARDLAIHATLEDLEVAESDVKYYLRYLYKAGYVSVISRGKGMGRGGVLSVYRLKPGKYTGPKAPMIQNVRHVYDPNLNEVVWPLKEVEYEQK